MKKPDNYKANKKSAWAPCVVFRCPLYLFCTGNSEVGTPLPDLLREKNVFRFITHWPTQNSNIDLDVTWKAWENEIV